MAGWLAKCASFLFDFGYQIADNSGMTFQEITAFLLENGWTQVEIAKEIGLSQPSVVAILNGHSNIRAVAADRLRKAYRKTARAVKKAA